MAQRRTKPEIHLQDDQKQYIEKHLTKKMRLWLWYEWLYAEVDSLYYNANEFQDCLAEQNLGNVCCPFLSFSFIFFSSNCIFL
jgi:hypothetical protein